ncbi:hypothetical protein FGB62_98g067 [Gracilaria domingensis]|nr:hypothetical protein FGB62_98g067 [Gracilaria domingensis]
MVPKIGLGGDCKPEGSVCEDGLFCLGDNGLKKCVKGMTEGQKCGLDPFWSCQPGLSCMLASGLDAHKINQRGSPRVIYDQSRCRCGTAAALEERHLFILSVRERLAKSLFLLQNQVSRESVRQVPLQGKKDSLPSVYVPKDEVAEPLGTFPR